MHLSALPHCVSLLHSAKQVPLMQRDAPLQSESHKHCEPARCTQRPALQTLPVPQVLVHCDKHWPATHWRPSPQPAALVHCDHSRTPHDALGVLVL